MVALLEAPDAGPDRALPDGATPLLIAAQNGHARCVAALVHGGADIDKPTPNGATALYLAARKGHADVCGGRVVR